MKLLILIFLISINYSLSDVFIENAKRIAVKSYPKKVTPGLYVIKKSDVYISPSKLTTKKPIKDKRYTVFPDVHKGQWNVPDSAFFPIEKLSEKQKRVKTPETIWRSKRSVVPKNKDDGKVTKKVLPKGEKSQSPLKPGLKSIKPQKLPRILKKPSGKAKVTNKNKQKKKKQVGRIRKQRRHSLRSGQTKNRHLKYTKKSQNRKRNRALRSKFGNKQARRLTKDRRNFQNMTKSSIKGARRLISGKDAMIEDYPYVVSIQKDKQHWCAGALLNQRLVITTANCLWKGKRVSHMRVRVGSRYTDRGGQVAGIQEVMKHPWWNIRRNPDHDIGLVLLDRNIKFSHGLHAVDLPNREMMPVFEDAWVTSWGTDRRDGVYSPNSNTLQVYHVRVMDRDKCNNVTERFGVSVTENFICMAQTSKRAPCTRDTGAPAVSDGVLWGLASWGIRKLCGTERFPAMFSYVGSQSNMAFIINATHQLMADERFNPFRDRVPLILAKPAAVVPLTEGF